MHYKRFRVTFSGLCAGAVNGLFGAGGGMVLVPLLNADPTLEETQVFPTSVSIILSTCLVSLLFSRDWSALATGSSWFLMMGSAIGGIAAGLWGSKIPTLWLHRVLGALILWGGFRYLC